MEKVIIALESEIVPCDEENLCRMAFFGIDREYVAFSRFWDDQDDGLYFECRSQAAGARDCVENCVMNNDLIVTLRHDYAAVFGGVRKFIIKGIPEADHLMISKVLRVLLYDPETVHG